MPYNEKSLQNLKRGNNAPYKKQLTKEVQAKMVEWLIENEARFHECMATLDPKEWVAAYLKLTSIMTPKQTLLDLSYDEREEPQFILHMVPNPSKQLPEPPAQLEP